MNKIISSCKKLYNSSEFARENLSFNETLSYLCEWQKAVFDPILLPVLTDKQRGNILNAFGRVVDGYPLGYIVGKVYFYTSEFRVTEGVLIPRRDSEILVETAVKILPRNARFLDLCTGSGCLGLSILKEREDTEATLVDISDAALETARENAKLLGVENRCSFLKFDLLRENCNNLPEHDAIIMNPPYLTSGEMDAIPENVTHEPRLALDGGVDGLDFYRLFKKCEKLMIFEIGAGQGDDLKSLYPDGRVILDLCRNPRVFIINENKGEIHDGKL